MPCIKTYIAVSLLFISACSKRQTAEELTKEGERYRNEGNYTQAIKFYTKAYNLDSNDYAASIRLGSIYAEAKKFDEAIEYFDRSLSLKHSWNAYLYRGECYLFTGRYLLALQDFDSSSAIYKETPILLTDRGLAYLKLGDNKTAVYEFLKALELNKSATIKSSDKQRDYGIYVWLGLTYYNLGQDDSAIKYSSMAIEKNTNVSEPYSVRSSALFNKGVYEEALNDIQKAIDIDHTSGQQYIAMARIYYELKKNDSVCSILDSARKYNAHDLDQYYHEFCR